MRNDAVSLEEARLKGIRKIEDYPDFHERHRIIPGLFEDRKHRTILDVAAGVGCAAARIRDHYPCELLCNDITPACLALLQDQGLTTTSFDLDDVDRPFPFPDGKFDAVISLATIEHLLHIDHFLEETHRILAPTGFFYVSTPNYAGAVYLPRFLLRGKSFHDPLSESPRDRYEFYAHVRYFTYRTLLEYVSRFGFVPDSVYLAAPGGSSRYKALYARSKVKAWAIRHGLKLAYRVLSPRWASEPILCFGASANGAKRGLRKVVL